MKKYLYLFFILLVINVSGQAPLTFHDYSAATIDHDTISMGQYYGKKVMVVNTASFCSYTPQFAGLEDLYSNYKQYGFEIIGFPCNDFGNQDPKSDSAINEFCTNNYNVTFQMMSKVATISRDTAPVYKWLQRADLNGVSNAHVAWNFNKFLIDEAGHWVRHYTQNTSPTDTAIINWIVNTPSVVSGINETTDAKLIELRSSNPGSVINLAVNATMAEPLTIGMFSTDGKLVANLYQGRADAGQIINYNAGSLNTGIYLIKVTSAKAQQTLKYVLAK